MPTTLVLTFIGADKPGLIEQLSNTVTSNEGNWLESRMSQLAGHFTGIARIQSTDDKIDTLKQALLALSGANLSINILPDNSPATSQEFKQLQLSLIGADRPGIVRELTRALAERNINVCEMDTNVTSAAMSAEPLFQATAEILVPFAQDINELIDKLDEIANDLALDINLDN